MNKRKDLRFVIGTLTCSLGIAAFGPAPSLALDYRGAEAVLAQAAEAGAKPKAAAEESSPAAQLRADLKAFQQKAMSLAPAEAATQWLALLDRFQRLEDSPLSSGRRDRDRMPVQAQEVVESLPPPEAWSALARAVEARPPGEGGEALHALGLKLLVHTLAGDTAKRQEDLSALEALAAKSKGGNAYRFNSLFEELSRALLESLENPELTLLVLERKIATGQSSERFNANLEVPELVALVGLGKAEAFLRKALVKDKLTLSLEPGTATDKLAQKLALELIDQLKEPHWSLVNSLDCVELYEAMEKRFGIKDSTGGGGAYPRSAGPADACGRAGQLRKAERARILLSGLDREGPNHQRRGRRQTVGARRLFSNRGHPGDGARGFCQRTELLLPRTFATGPGAAFLGRIRALGGACRRDPRNGQTRAFHRNQVGGEQGAAGSAATTAL